MKRMLMPTIAGAATLVLLSFLYYQAQRVDEINAGQASVLNLLQKAQNQENRIRSSAIQVHYERLHNFDHMLEDKRALRASVAAMQGERFEIFRDASTGVAHYINRLRNLVDERDELLLRFMRSVVLVKNAVSGMAYGLEKEALVDAEPELLDLIARFRNTLLAYSSNPTTPLSEQSEVLLEELEAALYELDDSPLYQPLMYRLQHGQVIFVERARIDQLLRQILRIGIPEHIDRIMSSYLAYHEQQEHVSSHYRMGLYVTGSLLLVFLIGTLIRLRFTARHLLSEKEMAQVTLRSIGDGVITTDLNCCITFMNPVAEKLTGVTMDAARGQSLTSVMALYSEITRKPVEDPARRCLESGSVIELTQHIYLPRDDGNHHLALTAAPIGGGEHKNLGAVLVIQDEGENRVLAEQLTYQSSHDSLTGLLNRLTFGERVQSLLLHPDPKNLPMLWHIDLDHFSVINDICGSKGGDIFLRQVSEKLKGLLSKHDLLSRVGGDEFAILRQCSEPADALNMACQLREAINEMRFEWDGDVFDISATIGVVLINQDYCDLSEVFMAAKSAVDSAREDGRNNICIHNKDKRDNSRKHELSLWVPRIKRALEEGRYRLYLQSIAPVGAHGYARPTHAEVLLRMEENGKIIPPIFIPAAEEYNLMPQIDRWVVSQVCAYIAKAQEEGAEAKDFSFSVNLSGTSVSDTFFLDFIRHTFAEFDTPTEQICFEITETAAIHNLQSAVVFIEAVRAMGCQFALDDFGSGMSSFAYLKSLPVDYLKIDGAFVKEMANDPVQHGIVEAINWVGRTLGMQTIAEFVENDAIVACLGEIGVDFAQGYGIDQPLAWDEYFRLRAEAVAATEHPQTASGAVTE